MKIFKIIFLSAVFISLTLTAQEDNPLNKLAFLAESDWAETGTWLRSGKEFNQKMKGEWGLNKKIIKLKIDGVVNMETGERGLRNEGIFAYDSFNQQLKYYVFDVYGGLAESDVVFEEDKIHIKYQVPLQGKLTDFRDTWTRIDEDSFDYEIFMINEEGKETKLLEGKVLKIN